MGAPVGKQKNRNDINNLNYYHNPIGIKQTQIRKNMIKKAYEKIGSSEKYSSMDNSEKKEPNKSSFLSDLKPQIPIRNIKFEDFKGQASNRSDNDVIPSDDSSIINQFMSDPKKQIFCKDSFSLNKTVLLNINCNFEERFFGLEEDLIFLILSFILDEYFKLISINSIWYCKINEILDNKFIEIDNLFIHKYLDIFSLKRGYNTFTPITNFNQNSNEISRRKKYFRIDRNLIFDIFPHLKSNF